MKKFLYILIIVPVLFLSSCNATRRTTTNETIVKLESQFEQFKNIKYKYGGIDRNGFDCSGFTITVYKNAFNISLPRTTEEISELGKKVSKRKLKPGDLVFFRPSRKYEHVGIYIGKKTFIHSSTSNGVIKSYLENPYWKKKYRFAKRILKIKG
jgi:cell wall-associated NlpC family hydrolase